MVIYAIICLLHLQNFRYDYIRIFFRKKITCQKIIGGAKPPRAPPLPTALEVAHEWSVRKRYWPNTDIITELTKCCFIICKSSDSEKDNPDSTEWRYSFSNVERKLVQLRSDNQNFIYLITKAIFYKYLKHVDPDNVSSFLIKTVMMWFCEEHPPNDLLWKQDFPSIIKTVQVLYVTLKEALQKQELKYYFIPSINILESMADATRLSLIREIEKILNDTRQHLPIDEAVISHAKTFNEIMKPLCDGWDIFIHDFNCIAATQFKAQYNS